MEVDPTWGARIYPIIGTLSSPFAAVECVEPHRSVVVNRLQLIAHSFDRRPSASPHVVPLDQSESCKAKQDPYPPLAGEEGGATADQQEQAAPARQRKLTPLENTPLLGLQYGPLRAVLVSVITSAVSALHTVDGAT